LNLVTLINTGIISGAVKNRSFFSNSKRAAGSKPETNNSIRYGIKGRTNTMLCIIVLPIETGLKIKVISVNKAKSMKIIFVILSGNKGNANNERKSNVVKSCSV